MNLVALDLQKSMRFKNFRKKNNYLVQPLKKSLFRNHDEKEDEQ